MLALPYHPPSTPIAARRECCDATIGSGGCEYEISGNRARCTRCGTTHVCDAKCDFKTQTVMGYVCRITGRWFGSVVCNAAYENADDNGDDMDEEEGNPDKTSFAEALAAAGGPAFDKSTVRKARAVKSDDIRTIVGRLFKDVNNAAFLTEAYAAELMRLYEHVKDRRLNADAYVVGTLYLLAETYRVGPTLVFERNDFLKSTLPHAEYLKDYGLSRGDITVGVKAWGKTICSPANNAAAAAALQPASPTSITHGFGGNFNIGGNVVFKSKIVFKSHEDIKQSTAGRVKRLRAMSVNL